MEDRKDSPFCIFRTNPRGATDCPMSAEILQRVGAGSLTGVLRSGEIVGSFPGLSPSYLLTLNPQTAAEIRYFDSTEYSTVTCTV